MMKMSLNADALRQASASTRSTLSLLQGKLSGEAPLQGSDLAYFRALTSACRTRNALCRRRPHYTEDSAAASPSSPPPPPSSSSSV